MDTRFRGIRIAFVVFLLLFALAPTARSGASDTAQLSATPQLVEAQQFLTQPTAITTPLPSRPQASLIRSIATLSHELGFPQEVGAKVRAANLSDVVAGRLANVLTTMIDCHRVTSAHYAALRGSLSEIMKDGGGLDPARFADIRECAAALWIATNELDLSLETPLSSGVGDIDIWPVVRTSESGGQFYANDYLLIVDEAGSDVYANNIGSNMVDVNFSPAGSAVPGVRGTGPARGCQMAIGTPGVGGLANGDCIPAVAVLLDRAGTDTYGVKQSGDIDAKCTAEPVIRRMVTGGVGFLGVGILRDSANSSDTYTGKTVTLGSGHVFGVGVLSDAGGRDRYSAVRNAQGFSLIEALGVLNDEGGNDVYNFYMPAPLDPNAPNETDGAGGVVDDVGACDNRPRFDQGGGNVGGVGVLVDDAGNDSYTGGFSDDFLAPAGQGRGGSQGFGNNGGQGVFIDRAGIDVYVIVGNQGAPARGNGVTILPDATCTSSTCSGGLFIDR